MANNNLRKFFSKHFINSMNIIKGTRCYHSDISKFPNLPLAIHDSDFHLFPESGQPFNIFVPEWSQLNYDEIRSEVIINYNHSKLKGKGMLKRTSESYLFLIPHQALQTAKEIPNKLFKNNHFISNEGTVAVEKLFPLEKLMTSAKKKLSELSSRIAESTENAPQVTKIWENVKEKLPNLQRSIANKLEAFQNSLTREKGKKKEEE